MSRTSLAPSPSHKAPQTSSAQEICSSSPQVVIEPNTLWTHKIMVENTRQFQWIVYLKEGISAYYRDRDDVFVAGDLAWMPDENRPKYQLVPDVMVVFGRPPEHRSSYKQSLEEDIPPAVVFEVLSPSNTQSEMQKKAQLYEQFGVEEFYIYDPQRETLEGYARDEHGDFQEIECMEGWTSPRLQMTFQWDHEQDGFRLICPDGSKMLHHAETVHAYQQERIARNVAEEDCLKAEEDRLKELQARQKAEQDRLKELQARQKAEEERLKAEEERLKAEQAQQQLAARVEELERQLALSQSNQELDLKK